MRIVAASRRPTWIVLAVVLIGHTLLLSIQTNKRLDSSFMRVWLLDSLAPIEKLFDLGVHKLGNIWQGYFALIGLHRENESLRSETSALKMQLARQHEEVAEAARLRRLLDVQSAGLGKTVVARVIGKDPAQSHQTVTIDKGKNHGIQLDTPVITPEGVVGRVIVAANWFSIVQLVVDSQSAVGMLVGESRRQGIVKGNGKLSLELDYIDDDNDIKPGDKLVTSGLDRIYPKGLPLGTVTLVGPRRGLLREVTIRPAADLNRLEEVLCITERPAEIAPPSE